MAAEHFFWSFMLIVDSFPVDGARQPAELNSTYYVSIVESMTIQRMRYGDLF
ncbi:MAG: hypothetical protein WAM14_19210 [Candidatus Nitrosopolaris sp.]